MRTELAALRSVPSFRRAVAAAIALAGVLAITFLGVKDLARSTPDDIRNALATGAVSGLVALAYAAGAAGGEVARGGLALALLSGRTARRRAVLARLLAHATAGALLGVAGALTAIVAAFLLLGFGGAHLPTAGMVAGKAAGTVVYAALMGALGAGLGLAVRSAAAAVAVAVLFLLGVDPLLAGISNPIAHWGLGGVSGALTGSGASDLEPAWAAALALLAYAGVLGTLATALTERRDVP
jgi:ABC-type transport system involved in multi-copper enzyme maturation permease subunit